MNLKRVVVTGLGALTPIGNNKDDYWKNLLKGKVVVRLLPILTRNILKQSLLVN